MKTRIATVLCLAAVVTCSAFAKEAANEEKKKDKVDITKLKCPMSGKACKETAVADHEGAKVYFCCPNCVKGFTKSPQTAKKFANKVNHQLVATKQAKQKGCPMSGKATKKGTEVKVAGVEVAFCCNNCKGAAEKKKGDAQIDFVFNPKAFKNGFAIAKKKDVKVKK